VTIPLQVLKIDGVGTKVGIRIGLGGGEPKLYTFDTGSSGLYAAYNPAWWPSFTPLGGPPIPQSYGSNLTLTANGVSTLLTIPTDSGELRVTADVGQITSAGGNKYGEEWMANVAAGKPPLYENFYGDFGTGLAKPAEGLFAVLPQLPGNLSTGFTVQLGCDGGGPESKVIVGLTKAITDRVTSWVPMQAELNAPPFPNSGQPSYKQALFDGNYTLVRGGNSFAFKLQSILDTGGGTTDVHQTESLSVPDAFLNGSLVLPGTQFTVTAQGTKADNGWTMSFVTGTTASIDRVTVSTAQPPKPGKQAVPEVNLALQPFFRYDVVFDVAGGQVGFAPCTSATPAPTLPVPTLSTWTTGLLASVLALLGALAATMRPLRRPRRPRD
jgi:hypothetical protein